MTHAVSQVDFLEGNVPDIGSDGGIALFSARAVLTASEANKKGIILKNTSLFILSLALISTILFVQESRADTCSTYGLTCSLSGGSNNMGLDPDFGDAVSGGAGNLSFCRFAIKYLNEQRAKEGLSAITGYNGQNNYGSDMQHYNEEADNAIYKANDGLRDDFLRREQNLGSTACSGDLIRHAF